jgi:hypothetical protein
MRLEPFVVPSSTPITATSAARMAARRRVVAMTQVTHPAPGHLTRHYTDNRRAAISLQPGGAHSSTGVNSRERPFPTHRPVRATPLVTAGVTAHLVEPHFEVAKLAVPTPPN